MQVWDIARAPTSKQFDMWRDVICQAFVPLVPAKIDSRPGFAARVEQRSVGTMACSVMSSRSQSTAHGPAEVRRTTGAYYFVNLQVAGVCHVRQLGCEATVRPGQFAIVDTTAPYQLVCPQDFKTVSFQISRSQLVNLTGAEPNSGAVVDTRDPAGQVVAAMMRELWALGGSDSPNHQGTLWERAFTAAIAATLTNKPSEETFYNGADLRLAIERFARANLQNPNLSAASVGTAFGISERHLHKLFNTAELSFAAYVRRERLHRCAAVLAASPTNHSIAAVAAEHGFMNPAAFSRAFRKEFGVTPREVRASATVPTSSPVPTKAPVAL